MTERMIKFDDVEIATQAFGNPAHEPILLIMGAMASMLWWPDGFCQKLADHEFYVIRYDNRRHRPLNDLPAGGAALCDGRHGRGRHKGT